VTPNKKNFISFISDLNAPRPKIKEIKFLEVGISISDAVDFYDIVLTTAFDSAKELESYQKHPEHVKIAGFIGKVRLERKVVDYII